MRCVHCGSEMVPGYRTCGACHAEIAPGLTPAGFGLAMLLIPLIILAVALAFGLPLLGLLVDVGLFWLWFRLFRRHGWCERMYARAEIDAAHRRMSRGRR